MSVKNFLKAIGKKSQLQVCRLRLRRLALTRVTFVAVTGSSGKTTTTALVGSLLSSIGKCRVFAGGPDAASRAVLSLDASTDYCICEVHAGNVGATAKFLRPHIAIVTNVGGDHYKFFRSLESTAQEKGRLVEALSSRALAILNFDDPHVRAMSDRTRARVISFGMCPDADFRAMDLSGAWPHRMSFTVAYRDDRVRIQTQLIGDYWVTTVLAAIACGVDLGLSIGKCAEAIAAFEPVLGSCSTHSSHNGPNYVLDTKKASLWTLAGGFRFMRDAYAPRKTIVIGTLSDYPGAGSRKYRKVAKEALAAADRVVFVGANAGHVTKLRQGALRERLFAFQTSYQASIFLAEEPIAGELIYVKASGSDHLERVMLAKCDQVVCWRERCNRSINCFSCKDFRKPHPPPFGLDSSETVVGEDADD
jgi:UDP-N-acetylmuramoyl-tripeptide--D-alanyl-D-alanine ligase